MCFVRKLELHVGGCVHSVLTACQTFSRRGYDTTWLTVLHLRKIVFFQLTAEK